MKRLKQAGVAVLCIVGIVSTAVGSIFFRYIFRRKDKLGQKEPNVKSVQTFDGIMRENTKMSGEEWSLAHGTFTEAVRSLAKMDSKRVSPAFYRNLAFRWWAERFVLQAELKRQNYREDIDVLLPFSLLDNPQDWEHMLNRVLENDGMTGIRKLISARSPNPEYVKAWVDRHTKFWTTAQKTDFMEQCHTAFPPTIFSAVFASETQEN